MPDQDRHSILHASSRVPVPEGPEIDEKMESHHRPIAAAPRCPASPAALPGTCHPSPGHTRDMRFSMVYRFPRVSRLRGLVLFVALFAFGIGVFNVSLWAAMNDKIPGFETELKMKKVGSGQKQKKSNQQKVPKLFGG